MKNYDFESWEKEYKDINNNLAVPLYRSFCKTYEINFHFGDEIKDYDSDKHSAILLDELPLHGKALSLFNFVNKPYHPFKGGLVSLAYTSWDDFHYKNLTLGEVADELGKKDFDVEKFRSKFIFYFNATLLFSSLLLVLITFQITNSIILSSILIIVNLLLLPMIFQTIYKRKTVNEQQKFNKQLSELKQELKNISIRYKKNIA